jgi:hypothetical protein
MSKKSAEQPSVKGWIRDRIVILALLFLIVGAIGYISAGQLFDTHSMWLHPVREFALLLSLIGVVSLGYELFLRELSFNEYKTALEEIVNPDAVRLGIQGIYKNRSELGQRHTFEGLFKSVKHEIFIGGTSLLSISTASRELLREKILGGVTVKLLLMDPESPVVEMITRQGGGKPTFVNEIKTSLLLLQKLKEEVEDSHSVSKDKFLIHTYNAIPSHSFISLDANESGGLIIADIGAYLGRNNQRPSMMVTNKKNGMYEYWQDLNDAMWADSKPLVEASSKKEDSSIKTTVLASGKETEYFDTETDKWLPASYCEQSSKWRGVKGSQWVWVRDMVSIEEARTGSQHQFRAQFNLPKGKKQSIVRAEMYIRSDDTCHVTVNDVTLRQEYGGAEYPDPFIVDIEKYLKEGDNTFSFELINYAKPDASAPEDNPAGLIYRFHIQYRD